MLASRKRQRWQDGYDSDATTVSDDGEQASERPKRPLRISAPPSSRASSVTAVTSPITKKCSQLSTKDAYFAPRVGCTQESELPLLPGESPPEPGDETSVPIRILKDFIIYDENDSNRIVSIEAIYDPDTSIRAYGLVAPLPKEEEDDDEPDFADDDDDDFSGDKTYELNLSSVFGYYVNPHPAEPMIWLQTQFAWYVLDRPDDTAMAAYVPYWKKLYLCRLALSTTSAVRDWYGLAYDSVTQEELGGAVSLFSTSFTEEEINGPNVCTGEIFDDLNNDADAEVRDALALAYDELTETDKTSSTKRRRTSDGQARTQRRHTAKPSRPAARGKPNLELEVLKHRNPTYATPFVRRLAAVLCFHLYRQAVKEEEGLVEDAEDLVCDPKTVLDNAFSFPCDVDIDQKWRLTDRRDPEYIDDNAVDSYISASCSDLSLRAGDFIVIRGDPKDDDVVGSGRKAVNQSKRPSWVYWFAQVIFFYKDPTSKSLRAHVRWLAHSSRTQLGESGHPRELVLRNSCSSVPISTIINKITVGYLAPGEPEPNGYPYRAADKDHFFYRYATDDEGALLGAERYMFPTDTQDADNILMYGCFTCHLQESVAADSTPRMPDPEGKLLLYKGTSYHLMDFVYIGYSEDTAKLKPTPSNVEASAPKPFRIGQIEQFHQKANHTVVTVRLFERYDDAVMSNPERYKDHKRLVASRRKLTVNADRLRGICHVMHRDTIKNLDAWVLADDHFYVDHIRPNASVDKVPTAKSLLPLPVSDVRHCNDLDHNNARFAIRATQPKSKLKALDLYHGAGGLSLGLHQSGAVETCWGIDFSPSAHATFKRNFPNATVILQCANKVLKQAIEIERGANLKPLRPIDDSGTACPPLPKPGDVDIVVCGPPCQGYSILNSHRRTDDIKNTLVANALSYVDHLRPRFFLLENVQPLLNSRGKVLTPGETEERIVENAVRKFIVRFLISRDYQVRVTVLQAGQFGAAQHRARVFFWAAKRGEHLPEFPLPTHTWASKKTSWRDPAGGAPLPCVGVRDVIGDLPQWHWKNPKKLEPNPKVPEPKGPTFDAVTYDRKTRACGFTQFVPYSKPAMTPYQKALRGDCKGVKHHATLTYVEESVERVCNVPPPDYREGITGGKDYRELPGSMNIWHLSSPHSQAARGGFGEGKYARVYPHFPARTVLTRNEPTGKQGRVLHYSDYRVMSAQENARLQGFPDSFTFISRTNDLRDIMRLIGNAVPIPLGSQLGCQLAKCLLAKESELAAITTVKEEEMS